MGMEYNPEDIPHVKGQDKKVESREKAYEMASRANPLMNLAADYGTYLQRANKEELGSELFASMENKGVIPAYLKALADLQAESTGAVRDYREEIMEMTTEQLNRENIKVAEELLLYDDRHPYVTAREVPVTSDIKGAKGVMYSMRPMSDIDYLTNTDLVEHQRVERLVSKLVAMGEEVERRAKLGANLGKLKINNVIPKQ